MRISDKTDSLEDMIGKKENVRNPNKGLDWKVLHKLMKMEFKCKFIFMLKVKIIHRGSFKKFTEVHATKITCDYQKFLY